MTALLTPFQLFIKNKFLINNLKKKQKWTQQ